MVILDLTVVGGMGGKNTVAIIKEKDPEATIVVSSGYSEGDVLQNYKKYGFDAVAPAYSEKFFGKSCFRVNERKVTYIASFRSVF